MHDVTCGCSFSFLVFFFLMPFLTFSHRKLWPSSRRWRAWRRRGWPWTTRVLWRRSWRHSVSKWSTTVKNLRLEEQIWCGGVGSRTWGWASEAGSFFSFSDIEYDKSPPCSQPLVLERLRIDGVSPWECGVSCSWIHFFSYVFLAVLSHPVLPLALFLFTSSREYGAAGKVPIYVWKRGGQKGRKAGC